jgi:hypothetical protein
MLPDLTSWCEQMQLTARRRIVLANIMFDTMERRLGIDKVRRSLTDTITRWQAATPGAAPERLVDDVIDSNPDFLCAGPPVRDLQTPCRVTDAISWWKNSIRNSASGGPFRHEVPESVLRHAETHGFKKKAIRRHATIRGRRPHAWITTTEHLAETIRGAAADSVATLARDVLGLSHYDQDQQLIQLIYPSDVLSAADVKAPTYLDGASTLVYRSSARADGWGQTVNLATGSPGAPEAVHKPIPLTSSFKIKYLGRVAALAGSVTFAELAASCPRPYRANDVRILSFLVRK